MLLYVRELEVLAEVRYFQVLQVVADLFESCALIDSSKISYSQ